MSEKKLETCFIVNETQAPISINYGTRLKERFIIFAKDAREVKKTTWKDACKLCPQLLDMVKDGSLRVLSVPEDMDEVLRVVGKLESMGRAKQIEIERMTPEQQAVAFQQKRRMEYGEAGNPFVREKNKEIV